MRRIKIASWLVVFTLGLFPIGAFGNWIENNRKVYLINHYTYHGFWGTYSTLSYDTVETWLEPPGEWDFMTYAYLIPDEGWDLQHIRLVRKDVYLGPHPVQNPISGVTRYLYDVPFEDLGFLKPSDEKLGSSNDDGCGMARYAVHAMAISLNIEDKPIWYKPAAAPEIGFVATYNHRAPEQDTSAQSHLARLWTFNWFSYLSDDPGNIGGDVTHWVPGGGAEHYNGFNATTERYLPNLQSGAELSWSPTSGEPVRYQKVFADGSVEVYAKVITVADERRVFLTKVIDPHGRAVTVNYDANNRISSITDLSGRGLFIHYGDATDVYRITRVSDSRGREAGFMYNSAGELERIIDPVLIESHFVYDADRRITSLETPYGVTEFEYGQDDSSRWIEATDPLGGKERFEYRERAPNISSVEAAPQGFFNGELQWRNTFYWDRKAMEEAPGDYSKARVIHWLKNSDGGRVAGIKGSEKSALESRVWYQYAGQSDQTRTGNGSRPTKVARLLDDQTTQLYQFEYGRFGKLTKAIDPVGRVSQYVYDPTNDIDLLEIRQGSGVGQLLAAFTWYPNHLLQSATDAAGEPTTFTYTSLGQLETVTNPKSEVVTYGYVTDSAANGYQRLQTITGALPGAVTSFGYDSQDRLESVTESDGYAVQIGYDAIGGDPLRSLDRIATITYPDGTNDQIVYDRLDPGWTKDRLNRWTEIVRNGRREVIEVTDPLARTTLFDWCDCGSLGSITDARGKITQWLYDIQGRPIKKIYHDLTEITYEYESTTSRLKERTDSLNQITQYGYYVDNNLHTVSYSSTLHPTSNITLSYDPALNRLTSMDDVTGLTIYGYHPVGSLGALQLASVDGPLSDDLITYTYDELRRLKTRTIASGGAANELEFFYDALGRVDAVGNDLGSFDYQYVGATMRLDKVLLPNGSETVYQWKPIIEDRRLAALVHLATVGNLISRFDYGYNAAGEITSWKQETASVLDWNLEYDAASQLRGGRGTDGVGALVRASYFGYDSSGNRTRVQDGASVKTYGVNDLNQLTGVSGGGLMDVRGIVSEPATVTINGQNVFVDAEGGFSGIIPAVVGTSQIDIVATETEPTPGKNAQSRTKSYEVEVPPVAAQTYSYDTNGNMTSDGTRTYEWDGENRLYAINYLGTNKRTEFIYDGLSRRVRIVETDGAAVTSDKRFVWDSVEIAEERDGAGQLTKRLYPQGVSVNAQPSAFNYYYTRDHLGSVREVTDGSGNAHATYTYDLYGQRTKISGSFDADFGFTGHYFHAPSELHLTLYRAYDAEMGRWLSRDPIEENGGINLYGYADNSPITLWDPLGLDTTVFYRASGGTSANGFFIDMGHVALEVNGTRLDYIPRSSANATQFPLDRDLNDGYQRLKLNLSFEQERELTDYIKRLREEDPEYNPNPLHPSYCSSRVAEGLNSVRYRPPGRVGAVDGTTPATLWLSLRPAPYGWIQYEPLW